MPDPIRAFWPDHHVRCACGREIPLKDASADGWRIHPDPPVTAQQLAAAREPMRLAGTFWRCFREARAAGAA